MKIDLQLRIEHFDGKYPSFNLHLSNGSKDPFITIRGCRIVNGSKGKFISYPATKNEKTGKYWNHVFGQDDFNDIVLSMAESVPAPERRDEPRRETSGSFDGMNDDIPF